MPSANILYKERYTMSQILQEGKWDEDANGKRWEDYETILCPDGTVIDMVKLIDEQYRAMAALNHLAPMFGGFISKLRFIYTFKVKTQATDGFNVFVNPQFTAGLDFTGKVFVMAHELMHCLLNHMRRGKGHDEWKSNVAADYEVNDTLVDLGLFKEATIKKIGALVDMKYKGWGYEKIYDSNPSDGTKDDMSNAGESGEAEDNENQSQSQSGSGGSGSSGSGKGQQTQYSDAYKEGWAKAIADYEAGLLNI